MISCKNCLYWTMYTGTEHSGTCRRYPPVVVVLSMPTQFGSTEWPVTGPKDSCGEAK